MRTIAVAFLAAGVAWGQAAATGTLAGQVLDERLKPVHGARVDVSLVPSGPGPFHPFQAAKLTASDGTFSVAAPAGNYRVCPQLPKSSLLNPCVWSRVAPGAAVKAGAVTQMRYIVMIRGYPLTVQLMDTASALFQESAKHSANLVLVGITAPNGMFQPMPVRQQNNALREHVAVVPRDTNLTVTVRNQGFNVTDSAGVAVTASQPYNFTAKIAGQKHPTAFTFYVNGLAGAK